MYRWVKTPLSRPPRKTVGGSAPPCQWAGRDDGGDWDRSAAVRGGTYGYSCFSCNSLLYSFYCTSYSKVGPLAYLSGLTLPAYRNAYLIRTRAVRRWNRTERSWPVSSYLPGPAPDKSFFLLLFSWGGGYNRPDEFSLVILLWGSNINSCVVCLRSWCAITCSSITARARRCTLLHLFAK
jgi:hypothetical protein